MALAVITSIGYSQTSITIFNYTSEPLTVGAISCNQMAPCMPVDSDSAPVGVSANVTINLPLGQTIQRVGASGASGSSDSFAPWMMGACGPDDLVPYTIIWFGSHVEVW